MVADLAMVKRTMDDGLVALRVFSEEVSGCEIPDYSSLTIVICC